MTHTKNRVVTLLLTVVVTLSLLVIHAYAATTVTVLDGQLNVTGTITGTGGLGLESGSTTVSGNTVTAIAVGGRTQREKNTISITNATDKAATITFDYSASNYNSFSESTASGTKSVDLAPGETREVMWIEGKKAYTSNKATLTLSNFSYTAAAETSAVTFNFTGGTITVDGSGIDSGDTAEISSTDGSAIVATPASGYSFLGWVNENTGAVMSTATSYTLTPIEDMTVKAAFASTSSTAWFLVPAGTDSFMYDDLNAAGTKAASCDKIVILAANGTLASGDYTIPAGVTLLIPFDSANTVYTTVPGCLETYTTPTAYRTLTMANGANITVNGSVSVGGAQSAKYKYNGYVTGPAGFIKMNAGSSISVENGGNLYAWGYITGSGSVEIKSGGTVYEDFQLADFRGGDGTSQMAKNTYGVFPMSQYYLQNIEVPLTLHAGAKENAYMSANITLAGIQGTSVPVVSGEDGGGMFEITSGYVVKDYLEGTGRLKFGIYGNISISPVSMTMKMAVLGSTTINSESFYLPIPGHFTIDAVEGNVTLAQDLAFLPGSELYISKDAGGTLGSGTKIVIYDWSDWSGYCGAGNSKYIALKYAPGGSGTTGREKDALIQVDGSLNTSTGEVYVTSGGANIYSTGTGVITYAPPKEIAGVYQATQAKVGSSQEITYVPITVKEPVLQDGDGTDVQVAAAGTYTYCANTQKWCPPDHRYETAVTAPTCTEKGYTAHTCIACGNSYKDTEVAALGHSFDFSSGSYACTNTDCKEVACKVNEDGSCSVLRYDAKTGYSYETFTLKVTNWYVEEYVSGETWVGFAAKFTGSEIAEAALTDIGFRIGNDPDDWASGSSETGWTKGSGTANTFHCLVELPQDTTSISAQALVAFDVVDKNGDYLAYASNSVTLDLNSNEVNAIREDAKAKNSES